MKNHIRAFLQTYHSVLEQFIQQGIDRKEFKSANAREAALTLASLYEGTLELTMLDPERVDAKKTLLSSFKLLMNGLENK